ncbi:MAG: chemotaxis protein CheX [Bdellovibrionota bacterium]
MAIQFFGQYLLSKGIITAKQLVDAVEYQESHNLKVGDYAVQKGWIPAEGVRKITHLQQTKDVKFGEAAVELGLLTKKQVEELLTAQKNDHLYLGDALVHKGYASKEAIDKALAGFKEEQKAFAPGKIDIPSEVPLPKLNAAFFDLTQKLLLRMGGVEAKLGAGKVVSGKLPTPGIVAQVGFSGGFHTNYIVCVPDGIARKMAKHMLDLKNPSAEELDDVVKEFANVVCGNILARLAQEGKQAEIAPPERLGASTDLGRDKALVFPVVTPDGELHVAVIF